MSLRRKVIKLAYENPGEIRDALLPVLQETRKTAAWSKPLTTPRGIYDWVVKLVNWKGAQYDEYNQGIDVKQSAIGPAMAIARKYIDAVRELLVPWVALHIDKLPLDYMASLSTNPRLRDRSPEGVAAWMASQPWLVQRTLDWFEREEGEWTLRMFRGGLLRNLKRHLIGTRSLGQALERAVMKAFEVREEVFEDEPYESWQGEPELKPGYGREWGE